MSRHQGGKRQEKNENRRGGEKVIHTRQWPSIVIVFKWISFVSTQQAPCARHHAHAGPNRNAPDDLSVSTFTNFRDVVNFVNPTNNSIFFLVNLDYITISRCCFYKLPFSFGVFT